VAALYAQACIQRRVEPGVTVAGEHPHLDAWMLAAVADAGVMMQAYTGVARASNG
jgi:hypothetical protein